MSELYILVKFSDDSVAHVALQTEIRAAGGILTPIWTDAKIATEIGRYASVWIRDGKVVASWRPLSPAEHEQFNQDRPYRDAMEDVGGVLKHNMPKARLLHQAILRHRNGDRFMTLDREWVDAAASGDKQKADAIEVTRKMLRDSVNDPRIATANTVEELKQIVPPEV